MFKCNCKKIVLFFILALLGLVPIYKFLIGPGVKAKSELKLYWLIPDGLRAEPDLFNIYEWAERGELPNLKKLMDRGAYGYSIPVFPSHTPVNYATLLTGVMPAVHGVADGPIHVEGASLDKVSMSGFRSVARKIPAVWSLFENLGLKVGVISTPGSTPPEIENGMVVRGRWGGWGMDLHALNFEFKVGNKADKVARTSRQMFFSGPELTQYVDFSEPALMQISETSFSQTRSFAMNFWGTSLFGTIVDTTDDHKKNYDSIVFSADGKSESAHLRPGEWSDWIPLTLNFSGKSVQSKIKFHVIKMEDGGFFRVRVLVNNLNSTMTLPNSLADDLTRNVGPMVDFVDNFPPQLIYYSEDEKTFLAEMGFSFAWHTKLIDYLVHQLHPNVVIHGIYNPNQMLTSRWWLGHIDPQGLQYPSDTAETRAKKWQDVKAMYKQVDQMIGEVLKVVDEDTVIVLSSDHGVAVLRRLVKLNNLLARKGYLKFKKDEDSGDLTVDWNKTRAIYLQMDGVFINPQGLAGPWKRGTGPEYEKLREQVRELLMSLKDETGAKPVSKVVRWEDAESELGLPKDRVGDLVIANAAGFGWSEELNRSMEVFSVPLSAGYKQAILTDENKSMWTPFVISGVGVRKGFRIAEPIHHIDQLPTILKIMNIENPQKMDGRPVGEIF